MSNETDSFGLLDLLSLFSLAIQLQNQSNILRLSDVQKALKEAVEDVHEHLRKQDERISQILTTLQEVDSHEK